MTPGSGQRWRRRLVLAAGTTLVALLVGEATVRAYVRFGGAVAERRLAVFAEDRLRHTRPRYRPHPYSAYALTPGYVDASGGTHHNALGFRGPELPPDSAGTRLTIAALGGSTTYGSTLSADSDTYPSQLEGVLRSATGRLDVAVVNAGTPGHTSFESLVTFAFRVLPLDPDIIVVYDGVNDLHARRARRYVPDNTSYRRSWSLEDDWRRAALRRSWLLRLAALGAGRLGRLGVEDYTRNEAELEPGSLSLLADHPPAHFRRNVVSLVRLARAHGIRVVLCTVAAHPGLTDHYMATPYYRDGLAEMNAVIRAVAAAEGVVLADVAAGIPAQAALWDDGVHLTAAGSRIQAEIVAAAILSGGEGQGPRAAGGIR